MKLMKFGPEKDADGNFVSEFVKKSNDLGQLKNRGLNIAEEMGESDAMWVTRYPIVGSSRMEDVKDWQLEISENCLLTISD